MYILLYLRTVCQFLRSFDLQATDDNANPRLISSRSRGSEEPHIGKYRLIKTIGKGNFAKVKLAKHVPTGREVSIHFVVKTSTLPTLNCELVTDRSCECATLLTNGKIQLCHTKQTNLQECLKDDIE